MNLVHSFGAIFLFLQLLSLSSSALQQHHNDIADLTPNQDIAGFTVEKLYIDSHKEIVGVKFLHQATGAPVYIFQVETVPQVFMWVDTPANSNRGLPHALEHLLAGKGTTGRYCTLLTSMQLSHSRAATTSDFTFYSFASGSGMNGFWEQFHAWMRALYQPDFTDAEAVNEFYHFGVTTDTSTGKKTLVEQGTVYAEQLPNQGVFDFYYGMNRRLFGSQNPFSFNSSGDPEEMRHVTPAQIRRFHAEHYRLGPGTGFIFAIDDTHGVSQFLETLSTEFSHLPQASGGRLWSVSPIKPKYPTAPSQDVEPVIFPFPSANEAAPGDIEFAWRAVRADSPLQVRLLQLLFRGLGQGQRSLLYSSIIDNRTRRLITAAHDVSADIFLNNSSAFPVPRVFVSGIPGNEISLDVITKLRAHILHTLEELHQFPDNSKDLEAFNGLVQDEAESWRRKQAVELKSPPQFGMSLDTSWKEYLEFLEIDTSTQTSITKDDVWRQVQSSISSGHNFWRDLIDHFHLLEVPFATASAPSREMLANAQKLAQDRSASKLADLMKEFRSENEENALASFLGEQLAEKQAIDKIQESVRRPPFTRHPPLSPDDIPYRQSQIAGVRVTEVAFKRPPTVDIHLNFDVTRVAQKYYKYLPMLPHLLENAGLRQQEASTSYQELLSQIERRFFKLSIAYSSNPQPRRADLAFRAYISNEPSHVPAALTLLAEMIQYPDLSLRNLPRLQNIVDQQLSEDDSYLRQSQQEWLQDPAFAFRYQDDKLYLVLSSYFSRVHFDHRLSWSLHSHVSPDELSDLRSFADSLLRQFSHSSRSEISRALSASKETGLRAELINYWMRNLQAFPDSELQSGLKRLSLEVQQDLETGPEKALDDLRELCKELLNRDALSIDIVGDDSLMTGLRSMTRSFIETLPHAQSPHVAVSHAGEAPIWDNLKRRYPSVDPHFPTSLGFVVTADIPEGVVFTADFPGYTRLDRSSLLTSLASKLFAGNGPESLFLRTWEAGLAYSSGIASDNSDHLLQYYADHVQDVPALMALINSVLDQVPEGTALDYALSQTFSLPRAMLPFSERGKDLMLDIRDGNTPTKIRRFSAAILRLSSNPGVSQELLKSRISAISPILVDKGTMHSKRLERSIFFFLGTEEKLKNSALQLHLENMLYVWPSDYWLN